MRKNNPTPFAFDILQGKMLTYKCLKCVRWLITNKLFDLQFRDLPLQAAVRVILRHQKDLDKINGSELCFPYVADAWQKV